ncbi:MAG: AAA family ATPase [Candidatus Dormibacteraeota bacterium]|jgi:CO dehydrogenase maturation factor|nr:AAA family ATPase [Candidatus Dormibacteraeota bacterium]
MRLAVVGKGGSGKTTITAALARNLSRLGNRVVAIDGDPNPNLAVALGIAAAERGNLAAFPRDLVQEVTEPDGHRHLAVAAPLHEIADRYGLAAPDGVRLLLGSQVEQAGAG